MIGAYASTTDHSEEDVEAFYVAIARLMDETPKNNVKFLIGDWNAKIGSDRESYEDVMGKYEIGDRNDRGDMLLEFAKRNKLCVTNTFFQ